MKKSYGSMDCVQKYIPNIQLQRFISMHTRMLMLKGRVAMKIVDKIVKQIREKDVSAKQAISTGEVIEWFKDLKDKKHFKFINWDIDNFYASITPNIVEQALDWAAHYVDITPHQRKVVMQSCQSFLYFGGQAWRKKGDDNFDVSMGAYHGAQLCELVGLFLMSRLRT